jgi:uncharacterized membrane-anchored protein YhcB (DUF1043 family)
MLLYVIGIVVGMVCVAWLTTKVVEAKHDREQEITTLHQRIDRVEESQVEAINMLERNLTDAISNVHQELIRENAGIWNKLKEKK